MQLQILELFEKNIPKAIYFFVKAIRNGNCMLTMFNLGRIYYYAIIVILIM